MAAMSATEAKNKFGQMLEKAQAEPVHIQKDGRDVAVVVSAEEYRKFRESQQSGTNSLIMDAHARSVKRWGKVYEALAK